MSERAAVMIEPPPVEEVSAAGGHLAVTRHLAVVPPPETELAFGVTPDEASVLAIVSEGHTGIQVARQVDKPKEDVDALRGNAMEKLGTRSIARAVHRAIQSGIIVVEIEPDNETLHDLRAHDRRMLALYARGVSNHRIARLSKQPVGAIEAYHDRLLYRLGAWSRPHAVRRGHELELLS